jgi:hypothetical protein
MFPAFLEVGWSVSALCAYIARADTVGAMVAGGVHEGVRLVAYAGGDVAAEGMEYVWPHRGQVVSKESLSIEVSMEPRDPLSNLNLLIAGINTRSILQRWRRTELYLPLLHPCLSLPLAELHLCFCRLG